MGMAVVAALIGVTLIGLYSWSINGYQELIADCHYFPINLFKICEKRTKTRFPAELKILKL